jgi:uncharacterized protein
MPTQIMIGKSCLWFATLLGCAFSWACRDRPAIATAAIYDDTTTVERLLKQGADPNKSFDSDERNALGEAAMFGRSEIVRLLIEHGADVEKGARGGTNATPLMMAASYGHLETVQVLLAKGTDVNRRDDFGHTALTLLPKYIDDDGVLDMTLRNAKEAEARLHDRRPQSKEEIAQRYKLIIQTLRAAGGVE